jgi:hypothetical protein
MATPTTLPASFTAGAVLTAAQMNDLRGAFRVLQVVQGTTTTLATSSSATFADTGLTATITPSSTSSKVLAIASIMWQKSNGDANNAINIRMLSGANVIYGSFVIGFNSSAIFNSGICNQTILDSPNTASAITYKLQFASNGSLASVSVNPDGSTASIILMEISA